MQICLTHNPNSSAMIESWILASMEYTNLTLACSLYQQTLISHYPSHCEGDAIALSTDVIDPDNLAKAYNKS